MDKDQYDDLRREVERLKEENAKFEHDAVFHRVKVEDQKEEIAALGAKLADACEREAMHNELRQETHKIALKTTSDLIDRVNELLAEIDALKAKLAEVADSNKFLVDAIDAAIKDREYFEGKLSENDRHGMELALAALDPTIPGHAQAAKYIHAAMEKKP